MESLTGAWGVKCTHVVTWPCKPAPPSAAVDVHPSQPLTRPHIAAKPLRHVGPPGSICTVPPPQEQTLGSSSPKTLSTYRSPWRAYSKYSFCSHRFCPLSAHPGSKVWLAKPSSRCSSQLQFERAMALFAPLFFAICMASVTMRYCALQMMAVWLRGSIVMIMAAVTGAPWTPRVLWRASTMCSLRSRARWRLRLRISEILRAGGVRWME